MITGVLAGAGAAFVPDTAAMEPRSEEARRMPARASPDPPRADWMAGGCWEPPEPTELERGR
eukprot:CAMPEP_0195012556 /NCGR_PEP_ID=MMETSP0326_2-20130528/11932_1 /TAXON_ID=2866 ORGANISM="Crypthecodinium cohnii, Strain Seligo" /NCGR_SAMPLE_ID=MMETSP0326_2 /ASSEMBLY_ACC=CAM_ASM_000348 /LENGTH=61 /DNA_ID=CAMNT_0040022265 /DNA_START=271 /DNA_END=453 /DNA_ORIENTATION=-